MPIGQNGVTLLGNRLTMIKYYIIGIAILAVAIIANGIAIKIGLKTWYSFLEILGDSGIGGFKKLTVFDFLWLFIGYPLVLGFGYWIGQKFYDLLF